MWSFREGEKLFILEMVKILGMDGGEYFLKDELKVLAGIVDEDEAGWEYSSGE